MKNWNQIASGHNLDIPAAQLERIAPPLDALEAAFRPLVGDLAGEDDSAVIFRAAPEDRE